MKKFFKTLYKIKFYFDITNSQTSWITGKLPEIVSLGVLLSFFGVTITKTGTVIWALTLFVAMALLGVLLKKTGVYDVEQYVTAEIHPVTKELLEAARKINKGDKK